MRMRMYIGAAIGLLIGGLIGAWALGGSDDRILATMQTVCTGIGGLAGVVTSRAGTRPRQLLCVGVGLGACALVAAAMLLYRWLLA